MSQSNSHSEETYKKAIRDTLDIYVKAETEASSRGEALELADQIAALNTLIYDCDLPWSDRVEIMEQLIMDVPAENSGQVETLVQDEIDWREDESPRSLAANVQRQAVTLRNMLSETKVFLYRAMAEMADLDNAISKLCGIDPVLDPADDEDSDDEHDQFLTDAEADGDALASAGMGTDEDYGPSADEIL